MDNLKIIRRGSLLGIGGAAVLAQQAGRLAVAQTNGAASASGVKVEKNVVVGKGGDTELHCDIYRPPAGTEKRMAIFHFHGGRFALGSKDELAPKVTPFATRGYLSIAAQYRLGAASRWPSQIEDAKVHIRWVREHAAELGIDPKHIGVAGYSAGGFIAVYTAGQPDAAVAACIASYAAPEISREVMPPGSDDAAVKATNTLTQIHEGYPPTAIFHGLADFTIPPKTAIVCCKAFATRGFPPNCTPSPAFRTNSTGFPSSPKPVLRSPISFLTGRFFIRGHIHPFRWAGDADGGAGASSCST
jgi:acetyl esterase/lipase